MAHKLYDVVVKTGSYTNANGEEKNRYENIGVVMQGDNGPYMMLKRTFNPAGVPDMSGRNADTVLVSLFEPQQQGNVSAAQHRAQHPAPAQPQQQVQQPQGFGQPTGQPAPPPPEFGDDIGF